MIVRFAILGAIALAAATPAVAQDDDARLTVAVTGGTLGIGPEVAYRLNETIGVRGNATFLSVNHGFDSDDIAYDGNVKLRSAGVMVDVYPLGGGFRISGGVRFNGNKARAIATPTGTSYTIDGVTYTTAQIGTLRADTDINDVAPALTLGYGGGLGRGFHFGFEAGALFQGTVKIKPLTYTGTFTSPTLTANLEAERQSLQNDVDDYKVYPIVQLSIGYRF